MKPLRVWLGSVLVALGVMWLLDAAGVLSADRVIGRWWPLAVIALGVLAAIANRRLTAGPTVVVLGGALLLVDQLGAVGLSGLFWPAIAIIVGLWLLADFLALRTHAPRPTQQQDVLALMGGAYAASRSDRFVRGSASALFGGATLDLREATLAPGARVETLALFGGVTVIVPLGWRVETKGLPIFGGFGDATRGPAEESGDVPELTVSGFAAFGGVEVKNPEPLPAGSAGNGAVPSSMGGRDLR